MRNCGNDRNSWPLTVDNFYLPFWYTFTFENLLTGQCLPIHCTRISFESLSTFLAELRDFWMRSRKILVIHIWFDETYLFFAQFGWVSPSKQPWKFALEFNRQNKLEGKRSRGCFLVLPHYSCMRIKPLAYKKIQKNGKFVVENCHQFRRCE